MSSSVTLSIATTSAIAAAKGFGWLVTGSPTLFAETVHSVADVGNQVLLKIGEIRARAGPNARHPFGHGQEKFFWALVSAVSIFFVGCAVNVYHGVVALLHDQGVEPFTPLIVGLLVLSLALEGWTFRVAFRELGGLQGLRSKRHDVTVLAVLVEDTVALFGILLTLLVAGVSYVIGPHPEFDAIVAIVVGVLLGVMALALAALNRQLLIDTSDPALDAAATRWLDQRRIAASVSSLVLDVDRAVVFVRAKRPVTDSFAEAEALTAHLRDAHGKTADAVYWQFDAEPPVVQDTNGYPRARGRARANRRGGGQGRKRERVTPG